MSTLPTTTLRDLAAVAIVVTELAWSGTKRAFSWLKPLVEPPSDLRVTSIRGDEYTGFVVIESNVVRAGVVVRVTKGSAFGGSSEPASGGGSAPPSWRRDPHLSSAPRSPYGDEDDCRLPGWADDSREEDAWYPRSQRK